MTLIVVDQGEKAFLDLILGVNMTMKLFTNNVTSGLTQAQRDALTEASFTEATFTGYGSKSLTGGSWSTSTGNPATGSYATQTFTCTADGTPEVVYGYWIVRASDSKLMWFEYFSAPVTIGFNGEFFTVVPRITLADTQD